MSAPKTLTIAQCHGLMESLVVNQGTQNQFRKGVRNYLIGVLMLETGIRVAELCLLKVNDLWFVGCPVENLIIRSDIAKGGKERQIPISTLLRAAITETHKKIWSLGFVLPTSFAFFAKKPNVALTTRTVERVIKSAAREGLGIDVNPHMLRHTFGTNICRKSNTAIAQALLGHASLSSTQVYLHPNSEDLKNAINGE